ncbi:MAG: bifunctional 4-hydroxy-3-methylbut-2-enyl diphosphate reductase/30S ribosomal protein S1 [Clostridiales bacterium]|nr:bifunctional 4-hydroxy-3-methylbut-2-enyl diphosphate reductase/30S ribosomal protein S1 [Clostridiales bacterium]
MKVTVAKTAGFCFGVKRAVDQVYEQIDVADRPVYTFGPIIHNEQVVEDLERNGVRVLETKEELAALKEGIVVIRSLGVGREIYELLNRPGITVVDATCPFVKKIHRIVEEQNAKGRRVIIVGNPDHPEVMGIRGWADERTLVVEDASRLENLPDLSGESLCVVSQTTFNYNKFQDLVEKFEKKGYDIFVLNTICNATQERQVEAGRIASQVDAMFVIGGRNSSNTQKLYEICRLVCQNTYFIQSLGDFNPECVNSVSSVGITAGASTPNQIIEELRRFILMPELNEFEQMLEESIKTIHTGEIVSGKVIDVKEDEIVLNIGYKSDGIIPRNEYTSESNADLRNLVQVGDEMEAKVVKVNDGEGQVALSYRRLAADKGNKRLEEAFENKEVLTAKVEKVLDGGLSVSVEDIRVFIPASLVSDTYEKDLSKYADQEIEFVITEFNPKRRRVIGDRKQLMVAKKKEMQKALFERIQPGDTVDGVVKNVTDFGAFIDLGGADGLLHISEMSWGRVENPKKVFHSGDKVTVLIKDINGEKIALSKKFPDQNPWVSAADKYAAGNIVEGRVARMTDFGAFIELEPGVDALLHVSQISREHVDKPSDVLKIGQHIEAKVVDFNGEDHKISLSIKQLPNRSHAEDEDVADVDIEAVAAQQR